MYRQSRKSEIFVRDLIFGYLYVYGELRINLYSNEIRYVDHIDVKICHIWQMNFVLTRKHSSKISSNQNPRDIFEHDENHQVVNVKILIKEWKFSSKAWF